MQPQEYWYNDKANQAVDFISELKNTAGRFSRKKFNLQTFQDQFLRELFGNVNEEGERIYREVYFQLPRKNGKTELAAAIILYCLLQDDEFGAEIYSAATSRDQAGKVFQAATAMVMMEPSLAKRLTVIESQKRIVRYETNSFYRAISAEAGTAHGFNAHVIIYDELHEARSRELYDVLKTSMGARTQPLFISITTAGWDRHSVCYQQYEYAKRVRAGHVEDKTFLPVIYEAEVDDDWQDPAVWAKANPALDKFRSLADMESLAKRALEIPSLENNFRRLFLNQWVQQEVRWMPMKDWDDCDTPLDRSVLAGHHCYAGLDLSSTTDISALSLVFDIEGTFHVLPVFFIPEEGMREREHRDRVPYSQWVRDGYVIPTPGNVIDYAYIRREIQQLNRVFPIQEIAYDRWGATQLAVQLEGEGFTMVQFGQGYASMSAPTKELLTLVLGRKLVHGNNPVLRFMADCCVSVSDEAGNVKLTKKGSTHRIDGIIATIMGLDRCQRHAEVQNPYDSEGIFYV